MARLSPDRVRTVRAVPTSLPPRWKGRRSVAPGRRERLSLMIEVAAPRNASMVAGSTDGAGGFFLSPIIVLCSLLRVDGFNGFTLVLTNRLAVLRSQVR